MAGLIAARMLADRHPSVLERQPSLPNNHHAVLRFRSSIVGDVTNTPFKKVKVTKHVLSEPNSNPVRDALIYARKATGKLHARSILDVAPSERFIAPIDFIDRLSRTADITYEVDFQKWFEYNSAETDGHIISTLPMPFMMDFFDWKDKPDFKSQKGWTLKIQLKSSLECGVYATLYSAERTRAWYRASLTGSTLMVEGTGQPVASEDPYDFISPVLDLFGLLKRDVDNWGIHEARYQKIAELTNEEKESSKRFMMWLTEKHRIYSLGRFATWRPKLLLDDLVNDVRVVGRLIDGNSNYKYNLI